MGSITSLLLRTLFNVSVTVNNLVVKLLTPTAVATLTCQSIHLHTATDGWQAKLVVRTCTCSATGCCCCLDWAEAQCSRTIDWNLDSMLHEAQWAREYLLLRNFEEASAVCRGLTAG